MAKGFATGADVLNDGTPSSP